MSDSDAEHNHNRDIEREGANGYSSERVDENDDENLDEFTRLVKFTSTYRERDEKVDAGVISERRVWYAPWKKRRFRWTYHPAGAGYPEEWLLTDIREGLSEDEVTTRRQGAGFNELISEKTNPFRRALSYFQGPILYVMELAVLLAAGLEDWIDFGVIIGILCLNAAVGWYQEKQAEDVVAGLKADIALRATVVRDNQETEIVARELVPGDVIVVSEANTVPADAKIICEYGDRESGWKRYHQLLDDGIIGGEKSEEAEEDEEAEDQRGYPLLACDHSAITGESLAVDIYIGDKVFYTTGCKRGKAYAVVQSTGTRTFVGHTAAMVQQAQQAGHFKKVMDGIGTALLVIIMAWLLAMWIGGFFRNLPIAEGQQSLLFYTLDLLIIGVPVGLPVVTTTTLAVGAAFLAKKKAIVQKLTATESLAGVDILCSDKTGTLTANRLSIREPYVPEGIDVNWMLAAAALASSHNVTSLDPIDKVTLLALRNYPKAKEILRQGWKTESFTPFDPVSKRIVSVSTLNGERYTCTKGAPKAVLQLTNCSPETANLYKQKATEFATRGFRSLGVGAQKEGEEWQLLGMMPMFDPPRDDTAETISEAQRLGIQVKMLTGDAIAIAKETCKMLSMGTNVYNSEKLLRSAGTVAEDLAERADGFAEVFPEHKYQVVEMLQDRGHLTAMTGDGVNDAPSLKKADCGIAVEGASDAAQSAADIVFLEPGLSTIIDSIKVARQIFARMKAYIQYRIALCLHLEIYLVTSMIIINESIRTDLIVFIALFADLATVAVAYDNAEPEHRPVQWQLPKIWVISVILGILLAIGTWVIRGSLFLPSGGIVENWGNIQEILFLEVALTENWLIFVTRGASSLPSLQLVIAIAGVDALATIFCLFGWLANTDMTPSPYDQFLSTPKATENGWTNIVTVVRIWAYSIGVEVVIALVYFVLNQIRWLNDLGRTKASKSDQRMRKMIEQLSAVSVQYEKEAGGEGGRYFLGRGAEDEEAE